MRIFVVWTSVHTRCCAVLAYANTTACGSLPCESKHSQTLSTQYRVLSSSSLSVVTLALQYLKPKGISPPVTKLRADCGRENAEKQ